SVLISGGHRCQFQVLRVARPDHGQKGRNRVTFCWPTNRELNRSPCTRSCAKSCTWGLAEPTGEGKSSGVLVYLLAYDQDRSNVAQKYEDGCKQTVLEAADHQPREEPCGSKKDEPGPPWVPPSLGRRGEIGLAPPKKKQGRKPRQKTRKLKNGAD